MIWLFVLAVVLYFYQLMLVVCVILDPENFWGEEEHPTKKDVLKGLIPFYIYVAAILSLCNRIICAFKKLKD